MWCGIRGGCAMPDREVWLLVLCCCCVHSAVVRFCENWKYYHSPPGLG